MDSYQVDNDPHAFNPDTPFHKARRETQSHRNVRYGFYPVATEIVRHETCSKCDRAITGEGFKLSGEMYCRSCLSAGI